MTGTRIVVSKNDFARIGLALGPKLSNVVAATAYAIQADAKETAPVKTGNLRRSLHTEFNDPFHAEIGTDVEYAPYIEYGTSRMAAQPFLTPAAELARAPFVAAIRAVFGRG